jgi:type IV pilus assembly protein PilN
MLDELATVTPKRLWLRKMEEKGGTSVSFEGTAATIDDVSAFMAALKASTHFSKVELKKTNATVAVKGTNLRLVDFSISAAVTYGGLPGSAPGATAKPAPSAPR